MKKYYINLDLYDRKILYLLDINARSSATSISQKIKLPKETVNFRIKRLVKNKYITHFYTMINASRLGYQYYKIFFKFNKMTEDLEKKVIDYIFAEKSCANLRISEGFYDICFVTMHKNPNDLKEFLYKFSKAFRKNIAQRSMHTMVSSHKLNQKFLYAGTSIKQNMPIGEVTNCKLDDIDMKIISMLSTKARIKLIDLAQEIKEDPKVIRYHMKKLENAKIITGYFSALNLDLFKRSLIQIDISIKDPENIKGIIEFFDNTDICVFASELLGKYDLSIELYIEGDAQMRKIMYEFKKKFINNYISYDISRIYKEFVVNWSPYDAFII